MNVIAIVSHSRPECLKIHLEQLLKNEGLDNFLAYFFLDYGFNSDVIRVIKWFKSKHKNIKIRARSEDESKKSPLPAFYNIMDSYRIASRYADEYVIPAEEDIIPTNDYLKFNDEVYRKFLNKYKKLFCVAHKRRPETEIGGKEDILIGDRQLTSPSCISVDVINKYLKPLMDDPLFFSNPIEFNKKYFPTHRNAPDQHIHHDGCLEKIADYYDMFTLKPDLARSMHIGIQGLHSGGDFANKSFEERYEFLRKMVDEVNGEELRKHEPKFKRDICIIDTNTPRWNNLKLDIHRNLSEASSWSFDKTNSFKEYINERQEEDKKDTKKDK